MTIRKGEPWGLAAPLPPTGVVVSSDVEAAGVVGDAIERGVDPPPIGLLGGDLCRTVGGHGDRRRLTGPEAVALPCDVGEALIDGRRCWFVAHLIVRSRLWLRGDLHAVMNAEYLGAWDVAPRGHPNDGRLEHLHVTMSVPDRVEAWRRLRTGTHLPHPDIAVRPVEETTIAVPRRARVVVDGIDRGRASEVRIRCRPDAMVVHV